MWRQQTNATRSYKSTVMCVMLNSYALSKEQFLCPWFEAGGRDAAGVHKSRDAATVVAVFFSLSRLSAISWVKHPTSLKRGYSDCTATRWLQNNTLTAEQHDDCRPTRWLQNNTLTAEQHVDCRTTRWLQNNTLTAEQHAGCRTRRWLQNKTLTAEQHFDCRTT